MLGRLTIWMYKCCRYCCTCDKRFAEKALFVQCYSDEANQAIHIKCVKTKTFKEAATTLGTLISIILRRFAQQTKAVLQPYSYVYIHARADLLV